jgi:VWFA-related protein
VTEQQVAAEHDVDVARALRLEPDLMAAMQVLVFLLGVRSTETSMEIPKSLAFATALSGVLWPLPVEFAQATFRSSADVVPVYATVVGPNGRLATGLSKDDFILFDDGDRQPISSFSEAPVGISTVAMWDVSNSMTRHENRARAAAAAFVTALWPGDRARFGTFGREIALSPIVTEDKSILRRVLDEELWFTGGGTPLWTALAQATDVLADEKSVRRVLLVLTDGQPSRDGSAEREALVRVHSSDVMVYAVGMSGMGGAMEKLARETGGGVAVLGPRHLDAEFAKIMTELHHQYVIGYTPKIWDGRLHSLELRTTVPGATVRSRRGYFAARD